MTKLNILISGSGLSGPVAGYFLAVAGHRVTLLERAPTLRIAGQQIDVRGAAYKIIQRMGLEQSIREKATEEQGLQFVNSDGSVIGEFPVGEGKGFSSDTEVIRGDLAGILYDAAVEAGVSCIFGDHISAVDQLDSAANGEVHVTFANSGETHDYDILIIADGLGSRTRSLVFGEKSANAVRSLGQYAAYFTIPYHGPDGTWSRWYNATGGRLILLRPDNNGTTRVWLSVMSDDTEKMRGLVRKSDVEVQKQFLRDNFTDVGFEAERVLRGMDVAEDFYMDEIGQVKMDSWSAGRAVLVGDAGYCPSPISGMGASVAITGAYVLAGEIASHADDYEAAFAGYEERLRPFVNSAQKLPPGAPGMANPRTAWGIWAFNKMIGFASWSGVAALMRKMSGGISADGIVLPDYTFET